MDKQEIVLFQNKKECCGCGACVNVCPKNAITMKEDEYGFLYPEIDQEKCIKCGACNRACAYQNIEVQNQPIETYVAVNKDDDQKLNSASGGLFSALATKVLAENGVVFGAALEKLDDQFIPHHIAVTQKEDLIKLQGSKYVQSRIENTYKEVKKYLQEERTVLFSGTPCLVAGLNGYLNKEYDNLITVDLICHGVPSDRFFNDFLKSVEKKNGQKVVGYSFRDKKKGWGMNTRIDFQTKNGEVSSKYIPARLASYNTLFLDGLIYRENCYSCKYACKNRPGDFTIGDYWGITEEHPELMNTDHFIEKDGISCLIVNTEKAKKITAELDEYMSIRESSFEKAAKKNKQLSVPSHKSEKREKVLNIYKDYGYDGIENLYKEKYRKQRILHWIFNKLPRNMRNVLKKIMKNG